MTFLKDILIRRREYPSAILKQKSLKHSYNIEKFLPVIKDDFFRKKLTKWGSLGLPRPTKT